MPDITWDHDDAALTNDGVETGDGCLTSDNAEKDGNALNAGDYQKDDDAMASVGEEQSI